MKAKHENVKPMFQCSDGALFSTEALAVEHEKGIERKTELTNFLMKEYQRRYADDSDTQFDNLAEMIINQFGEIGNIVNKDKK